MIVEATSLPQPVMFLVAQTIREESLVKNPDSESKTARQSGTEYLQAQVDANVGIMKHGGISLLYYESLLSKINRFWTSRAEFISLEGC